MRAYLRLHRRPATWSGQAPPSPGAEQLLEASSHLAAASPTGLPYMPKWRMKKEITLHES